MTIAERIGMNRKELITAPFEKEKEYMEYRIKTGIEENRKDFLTIEVRGKNGNVLPGVQVELEQKSHQFMFGANLFLLDEMETEEKNQEYRRLFPKLFNQATLPFYWCDLEPEPGKTRYGKDSVRIYRRPNPELCLEFCEENQITPKAHCLIFDVFTPVWVPGDIEQSRKEIHRHLHEVAQRYNKRIRDWEVTNETLIPLRPMNTPLFSTDNYVEWCFETAHRYFPANRLLFNESGDFVWPDFQGTRSAYYQLIERALNMGKHIDGIGMQYHVCCSREDEVKKTEKFYDPRRLYDVMDTYGRFRRPLQITEITIPAYSNMQRDEEVQAEIVRNLYRIWFSHPAMEGIIWWNMVDGYAFAPEGSGEGENVFHGGLLRHDMSKKPVWYVLDELINREWHTRESRTTDGWGKVTVRGFYGNYRIKIFYENRVVEREISLNCRDNVRKFEIKI